MLANALKHRVVSFCEFTFWAYVVNRALENVNFVHRAIGVLLPERTGMLPKAE